MKPSKSSRPATRFHALRRAAGLASLGVLAAAACQRAPSVSPRPEPLPELRLGGEIVRIDAEEAATAAREARQEVAVETAPGLEVSLWATEKLIADPIALTVDERGHVYVTRTHRDGSSTIDIRGHRDWMVESMRLQSVEDRRSFLRRELAPERSEHNSDWLRDVNEDGSHDWRDLAVKRESLHRLVDTDGDGRADLSQLMLQDFGSEVTDVAGGLLVNGDDVYFGVAPDLWRLRDADRDGVIDGKESISHGYMAHVGFGGHGVSGVTLGPDGRIYWSMGDLGTNVVDKEGRRWEYPNEGVILRSNPDGTDFEVFAAGLRNIHEFAFDQYGNLISVDNDGDHPGETERLVYITEGQDSGWRINWQFGKYVDPTNNGYKVWMDEGVFRPRFEGQAAWFTPPLASFHTGPTGFAYNPGTALSPRWRDHFLVGEFTGQAGTAKIHAFQLAPRGAGFELSRDTVMLRGILATGFKFGPDGALYLADWIEGWDAKGRGRVWKLDDPSAADDPLRAETRALLGSSFEARGRGELIRLLEHADMRVRLKSQMELARRTDAAALRGAARQRKHQLARLHGIWGLGQLARSDAAHAATLLPLLRDQDAEIRAQAARVLGDVRHAPAADLLVPMLTDPSPRVRFFAAEALGRLRHAAAVQPLIAMLRENDDRDVYLRHAGTLALSRIGQADPVVALAHDESRALRIAAVVTLRRMQHAGVARFLADRDEYVVAEAARAVNDDASIPGALPELARTLEEARFTSEPLLRRAINANLRVGTAEAARRVAAFAARPEAPEEMRVEAIATLGVWPEPSVLDRVDGSWRGAAQRDTSIARAAVEPLVRSLLTTGSSPVKIALAEAVGRLRLRAAGPALLARVRGDTAVQVRVAALRALHAAGAPEVEEAARIALAQGDAELRMSALELTPSLPLPEATRAELLSSVLGRGTVQEQQSALRALGELRSPQAQRALAGQLDRLVGGKLPAELQLDVMEAVETSGARPLATRLERYRAARPVDDVLATFAEVLKGGHAGRGRQIVLQNPAGQCTRCHVVGGRGGNVGPDLGKIGGLLSREQLLQALVDPNARIAPGFGSISLTLTGGQRVVGVLREETDTHLTVQTPGGDTRRVAKGEIAQRTNAPSAMPPMGHLLSRRELRDVVEYLSTLR